MSPAKKNLPDLRNEYDAPFSILSHKEGSRYTSLKSRDFNPPRFLDFRLIETLGWKKTIDAYFRTLGFQKFVKMRHDGYRELMLEFYTTLSFSDDGDDENAGFRCRLMGKSVKVTRETLCEIFGFREGGHETVPKDFDPVGFWIEISGGCGDFKVGRWPCALIKDPILLLMYKYIAHGILGRVDSGKVPTKELFYLSCLHRGVPVCTPCFLIETFKSVQTYKRMHMCLGNFITAIADHFGMFDPTDMTVLPMQALGLYRVMKHVSYKGATDEASPSSHENGEDTKPVAIDDQPAGVTTTPPAVDTWMLISRKLEQMQTRMDGGFNAMEARFDVLEKKVNTMCARFKNFVRKRVDMRQEGSNGTKTVEEMKQENLEATKNIEKLRLEKSKSDKAAEMYKTRLDKLLPSIKRIEEGLSKISSMKVVDLVNLENDMRELVTFKEGEKLGFPDSRDKIDTLGNGSMPDVNAEDVAVLLPRVNLTSSSSGCRSKGLSKNGDRNSPQPWTREHDIAHTVKNSPGLQSGHNPQPQSEECIEPLGSAGSDIIEILDNDDETNPNGAVETSKRVVGSNEMNLVQRSKRNRTESMGKSFAISTTKRKQVVRTVDEDKALIHDKGYEVLKSSHDRVDFSPSGRRVEKARDSQNGLSDEVSADSEDGSLSDSRIDDLIASLRRENRVKTFLYEADMLRAFQQDEELCLNAVCALYRRKFLIRNSNGFTLSINRGFSPIDSMSGCAMAEYLIDGDKELRLTKSVAQVKRQRPDAITMCRKLAIVYVEKLFEIYNAGDDPLFCQS